MIEAAVPTAPSVSSQAGSGAPLIVVVCFQLVVLVALVNSVIQFTIHQTNQRRRFAAVVSSLCLLLILSIYYARTLGGTLQRIAGRRVGSGAVEEMLIYKIGRWVKVTYFDWWMNHLPTIVTRPAPYRETLGPILAVGAAYVVRAGIYRFYRRNYPKRQVFASAYWVHITLYFVIIAFLRRVYRYDKVGIATFTGLSIVLMIGGIASVAGDIAGGTLKIVLLSKKAAIVSWKWCTLAATAFADFVRLMRREFNALYARYIREPARRFYAKLEGLLNSADARAERRMADSEARENARDGARAGGNDDAPPPPPPPLRDAA